MNDMITIDVTGAKPDGLGLKHYKNFPRIGEWVELGEEDHPSIKERSVMYEVVMVAHSSEGAGADIYVRKVGWIVDAQKALCGVGT